MWTRFELFIDFVTMLLLLYVFGFLAARQVGSQVPDRGWDRHPCIGRRSLNRWTSREAPIGFAYFTEMNLVFLS